MKSLTGIVAGVLIGTALAFGAGSLGGCGEEGNRKTETQTEEPLYSLVLLSSRELGNGYEKPEGLKIASSIIDSQIPQYPTLLAVNPNNTISSTFLERPILSNFTNPTFVYQKEPKINRITGTLAEINTGTPTTSNIFTFPPEFASEFNTLQGYSNNGINIPFGLSLRIQQLGGDYLVSKNPSNRISKISNSLESTFVQDDALLGIVDMIQGSNGRTYFAEAMLVNCENLSQNEWTVARPRRVISIDPTNLLNPDRSLNYLVEFTLPDEKIPIALTTIPGKSCYPTDDMVRIIENSLKGKLANAIDFFVSDFLNGKIYSITGGIVSPPFRSIPYPTALAMEQNGKILVTKGPVLQGDPANSIFLTNSQMNEIDPANSANDLPLYPLDELVSDFQGYLFPEDPVQNTWIPKAYSVSLDVAETDTDLTALVSNTASGKVIAIQFQKAPVTP